ncbi:MAG: prepilin-type N-terminal cleavage/methylation domain-containing protein [Nitrospiria bacterium]
MIRARTWSGSSTGFTFVELMLVMAIIGILAAISIPQFNRYRARAYNAQALTDVQTVRTVEMVFFMDRRQYASTSGTGCAGDPICTGPVTFTSGGAPDITLKPGGALEAKGTLASFTAVTKHLRGDRVYCVDSDNSTIRYANDGVNVPLGTNFSAPNPVADQDDCAAGFPSIQ